MVIIDDFLNLFLPALKRAFGERLWFVGLQGSYARLEADDKSDIDVVVILDKLTMPDISIYNEIVYSLPEKDIMCGFISGKNELFNWDASELFQFYYDTKPIIGSIEDLLSLIDDYSVNRAIKASACTIYHSCIHNILYEKSYNILIELYKAAVFSIQAISYKQTGSYICRKTDLINIIEGDEKTVLNTFLDMKKGMEFDFIQASELLFTWSGNLISEY